MEFRRGHLLYFVTVAEEGQITRAANKLHLAQPALSQAIARLESDLGVTLLKRHPRGVTLTPAGTEFLIKARAAVAAWSDAVATARSMGQSIEGTIELGFVGSPPGLDDPGSLAAFKRAHPRIDLRYRELPFPVTSTTSWLAEVDAAACHLPPPSPEVWSQPLRRDPRVVLASKDHPIADRSAVSVDDLLDQAFVGFHPSVEPSWAGFWSLDDHRGGPPEQVTPDQARNAHEVFASLAGRCAITTVPASTARMILTAISAVAAIPLRDAEPATVVLVGRNDRRTPQVAALCEFAASASAVQAG